MKRLFQFMVSITLFTLSGLSYAQDSTIQAVDVFPVNQSVLDSTDAPISVIETAEIADSQGRVARGPHDVVFSLTDDAPYAIKIGGKRIDPGSSITLTIDLTRVGHRLQMPVFPAESGKYGKVDYKLSIPNLNIKVCPDGFQERPEDCYKIEFREINYICPASFTYNSNLEACRRQVNLELVNDCPDGFSRGSGDTCTRTTTAETVEYCADDTMSIEGDSCIKRTYSDTMACPETYSRDDSGRCSKVTNSEPTQSCPENFTKVGNSCQRLTQAEPTDWSCPSSHPNRAEDSESCFATQPGFEEFGSAESELSCGSGYTFEDSRCVQYTEPTYQCSRGGYNTETGACEYTVIKPESNYCGSTEVEGETCETLAFEAVGVYCKAGFVKQSDNSCMKLESAPVQNKCQSGYTMNADDSACTKTETLTLDIKCPSGYARSSNGAYCYKTDQMSAYENCATGYTNVGGGVCEKLESKLASTFCDAGWTKDGDICKRTLIQDIPSCPSGMTLRDGECHDVSAKLESCLSGYSNRGDGTCAMTETKAAEQSCDAGYSLVNGTCKKTESQPANKYCPTGATEVNGVCTVESITKPELQDCASYVEINETNRFGKSCPDLPLSDHSKPFCAYGDATASLDGGVSVEPPVKSCPTGRLVIQVSLCPDGSAPSFDDEFKCPITKTFSHEYSCPSGWSLSGTSCSRTVTDIVNYSCDSGWSRSGSTCSRVLTDNVDYYCASGYTSLNGSSCYKTTPDLTEGNCPSGYALNTSTGDCRNQETTNINYRCESGWILSGSQCKRTLTSDVVYSCPNNKWTLNNTVCDFYDEDPLVISCPDTFTYNSSTDACERVDTQPAILGCADGFSLTEDKTQCFRETIVPHL